MQLWFFSFFFLFPPCVTSGGFEAGGDGTCLKKLVGCGHTFLLLLLHISPTLQDCRPVRGRVVSVPPHSSCNFWHFFDVRRHL